MRDYVRVTDDLAAEGFEVRECVADAARAGVRAVWVDDRDVIARTDFAVPPYAERAFRRAKKGRGLRGCVETVGMVGQGLISRIQTTTSRNKLTETA